MTGGLAASMTGDGVRAESFHDKFRPALGDACAEDSDIWALYGNDFGPAGFDASLDSYLAKPDAWWEAILSYNAVRPYAQKVFDAANDYGQRTKV